MPFRAVFENVIYYIWLKERGNKLADIVTWLTILGLGRYVSASSDAEIDFETLPDLEEEDLKGLGLPLGPRRKVWGAIQRLENANVLPPKLPISTTSSHTEVPPSSSPTMLNAAT